MLHGQPTLGRGYAIPSLPREVAAATHRLTAELAVRPLTLIVLPRYSPVATQTVFDLSST